MFLQKRSSGIYHVFYKSPNGRWTSISTRTRRKEGANRFLRSFTGNRDEPKSPPTVSGFVRDYLHYSGTNHAKSTQERVSFIVKCFEDFIGGETNLDAVKPQNIEAYKVRRLSAGISPATINIELRTLKAFLGLAVKWDLVPLNPFRQVRMMRVPHRAADFLTIEELHNLVANTRVGWLRDLVVFAASTGLRRGEAINLTWEDVDLPRGVLRVRNTDAFQTKSRRERLVPLNTAARRVLARIQKLSEFVFTDSKGKQLRPTGVSQQFRKAANSAGLSSGYHFHSLRHTFASWLVQAGVNLYEVKELLGHENITTTQVYAHLQPDMLHDTVNKISLNMN